jgi:hypothetical protein
LRLMNVPKYDVYTPVNVFGRAGDLINWLFSLGNVIKESQQNSELKWQFYQNINSSNTESPTPIVNDTYTL